MRAVLLAAVRVLGRLPVPLGIRGKAERRARKATGMAARHPERLAGELPEGQEEWLAGLAAELWPDDEYAQIITETRREDQ
jgi:hypothetical protein